MFRSGRLWDRGPSCGSGSRGAKTARVRAQKEAREERRLQHRGAAGCGRLGGALPRQGARAELRSHAHEHSKSVLVFRCERAWISHFLLLCKFTT